VDRGSVELDCWVEEGGVLVREEFEGMLFGNLRD
jgi:hypothetical protein